MMTPRCQLPLQTPTKITAHIKCGSQTEFTRVFTPRPNVELYKSASTTNYGFQNITSRPWINMGHDAVPHYGFKM